MKLVIANKIYSSWSLRAWLLLRQLGVPFEEILAPFGPVIDDPGWKAVIAEYSPAGRVPVLIDGDVQVWESLAIMEYVAEAFPDLAVWPRDRRARALARAVASEMHAGFSALRGACPMNFGKRFAARDRGPAVAANVARILAIWSDARARFGALSGEPFLFGSFGAVDAMFAPVAVRLEGYSIEVDDVGRRYMDAIFDLPAFRQWRADALRETWIAPEDEVDEPVLQNHRFQRDRGA